MERAARLGLPVAVHAENDTVTQELAARARAEGRHAMSDYLASRPVAAELEAVGRAIAIAEETGCSLHIVHASTAAAVLLVAEARSRGVDVTCETCPHYLLLTDEDAERIGALAKCSPPVRPRAEVEALWAELLAGTVPFVDLRSLTGAGRHEDRGRRVRMLGRHLGLPDAPQLAARRLRRAAA